MASRAYFSTGPVICDLPGWIVTWRSTKKEGYYFARLVGYPDMMVVPSLLPGSLRGAGRELIGLAVSLDVDLVCKRALRLRLRDPAYLGTASVTPAYVYAMGDP